MKFHYIVDNKMVVSEIVFGKSLAILNGTREKAQYVTIDAKELEEANMGERPLIDYVNAIRRKILVGGKVYLEIANYS